MSKFEEQPMRNHERQPERPSTGGTVFDTTHPDFNTAWREASRRPDRAVLPALELTEVNQQPKPEVSFQHRGGSEKLFEGTQREVQRALGQLNDGARESLRGLRVEVGRGGPDDPPGDYRAGRNDTIRIHERALNADKEPIRNVVNHELGHPLDKRNKEYAQSPEFREAFDNALQRLPRNLRADIERGYPVLGRDGVRSEIFADLVALNFGTPPEALRYLRPVYQDAFGDAAKLVRRRFFK